MKDDKSPANSLNYSKLKKYFPNCYTAKQCEKHCGEYPTNGIKPELFNGKRQQALSGVLAAFSFFECKNPKKLHYNLQIDRYSHPFPILLPLPLY